MRKIDRRIVIVAMLIFTIGLAFGLMRYLISLKEDPKTRPQKELVRYVNAEEVKYMESISPVEAPGRVASISQLDIVSEASGKINVSKIPLKKGAQFQKGDLLFTIYPDETILALKARKSQYLTLLVNLLPDIHIDYPDFENDFNSFYQSINLDQPLPKLPSLENNAFKTFLASRNILSEYYVINKDELSLQRRSVYAPFNGTYTEVLLESGAYTNMGGRVAIAIQTDILDLEIPLERFHSEFVQIGDPVRIVSDKRGKEWSGKVIRKSQFVDPGTQSQSVFVQINNTQSDPVLAGEYLSAVFKGQAVSNVMEVNRNAVFNNNEVFIIIDGRLQKREINIIKTNEKTLLFRGLKEGVTLVTQPLINVMEGSAVSILGETQTQAKGSGKQNQKKHK
ncbi:MAG: hypothetical protein U9N86_01970 [Bacteroidota bacterium]|nr:hypothetical protein [Bacteroidota bacterium]